MVLDVKLKKKVEKTDKTKLSQQMLVNTLLSEKQPTSNSSSSNNNYIPPVNEWK